MGWRSVLFCKWLFGAFCVRHTTLYLLSWTGNFQMRTSTLNCFICASFELSLRISLFSQETVVDPLVWIPLSLFAPSTPLWEAHFLLISSHLEPLTVPYGDWRQCQAPWRAAGEWELGTGDWVCQLRVISDLRLKRHFQLKGKGKSHIIGSKINSEWWGLDAASLKCSLKKMCPDKEKMEVQASSRFEGGSRE